MPNACFIFTTLRCRSVANAHLRQWGRKHHYPKYQSSQVGDLSKPSWQWASGLLLLQTELSYHSFPYKIWNIENL